MYRIITCVCDLLCVCVCVCVCACVLSRHGELRRGDQLISVNGEVLLHTHTHAHTHTHTHMLIVHSYVKLYTYCCLLGRGYFGQGWVKLTQALQCLCL